MVDHVADLGTKAVAPGVLTAPATRTAPRSAPILVAGEADAFPPAETPHWSLRTRAGLVLGLALLSWVAIGGGLLLFLHR